MVLPFPHLLCGNYRLKWGCQLKGQNAVAILSPHVTFNPLHTKVITSAIWPICFGWIVIEWWSVEACEICVSQCYNVLNILAPDMMNTYKLGNLCLRFYEVKMLNISQFPESPEASCAHTHTFTHTLVDSLGLACSLFFRPSYIEYGDETGVSEHKIRTFMLPCAECCWRKSAWFSPTGGGGFGDVRWQLFV